MRLSGKGWQAPERESCRGSVCSSRGDAGWAETGQSEGLSAGRAPGRGTLGAAEGCGREQPALFFLRFCLSPGKGSLWATQGDGKQRQLGLRRLLRNEGVTPALHPLGSGRPRLSPFWDQFGSPLDRPEVTSGMASVWSQGCTVLPAARCNAFATCDGLFLGSSGQWAPPERHCPFHFLNSITRDWAG